MQQTATLFDHLVGARASNSAFSLALSCSSAARLTLGKETSAGPIGQQFLELQSHSSSEKLSRIIFL
jgi:hypothetical protein